MIYSIFLLTVIYLDSSVFNYRGKDISVIRWNFSEDGKWMLLQSERNRIWRHSNKGTYYLLRLKDRSLHKVSKKNDNLRNSFPGGPIRLERQP